ncbi:MAG: PilZ domain-containing protein [Spirochaetales bacterium]|nr:PilZ domain-containing protein [Spirochaetales bacterium]
MWIISLVAIVILVAFFLLLRKAGGGRFPWLQFYTKGKESGFTFREVNLLRKVAVENKLKNPASLFWSIKQLDRSIKGIILKFRSQKTEGDDESNDILSKLFELRKKVEFDLPKYKLGLKSSRNIATQQRIKIMLPGEGPFFSMIVENLSKYMAVSYPQGPRMPNGFSWKGQKIGVYFWRKDDAGYFFQTKVLEDFFDKKYPILHIAHSNKVIRTQKRRSIRVETDLPASIYPLRTINEANENLVEEKGLRSRLLDLSEDGAAILIGGRAKVGLPLKVQFFLDDSAVVMCGVVKGVNFDEKRNRSTLHLQAVPLSPRLRNKVLAYVYNLFGERDIVGKKNMQSMRK